MRGAALVGALLIVALATAAAVAMASRQQLDLRRTEQLQIDDRLQWQALALEHRALQILREDAARDPYDGEGDAWATRHPALDTGVDHVDLRVEDLQARFNLNALRGDPPPAPEQPTQTLNAAATPAAPTTNPARAAPPPANAPGPDQSITATPAEPAPAPAVPIRAPTAEELAARASLALRRLRRLLDLLDIDTAVADAIVDWIDADSAVSGPGGAEDEYYLRPERGYRAANRALVDLTELLLVRGVTPAVYERLAPHVCALPAGAGVNINTATPMVLRSLAERLDRMTAERIASLRATQPYPTLDAFLGDPVVRDANVERTGIAVASSYFRMHAQLAAGIRSAEFSAWIVRPQRGEPRVWRRERGLPDG